jgi:hypothetical protein
MLGIDLGYLTRLKVDTLVLPSVTVPERLLVGAGTLQYVQDK